MENLEEKICAFLKGKGAGAQLKALEISKGVGLRTAKDVNKALYSLKEKGCLKKAGDTPPLWSLVASAGDAPDDSITFNESSDSDTLTSVSTVSWFQKNYSSVKKLGEGGFGSVYIATKKHDEIDYAIKVVEFDEHALREVQALAKFDHSNIVRYFGVWEESSLPQCSESRESTDEWNESASTNASSKSKSSDEWNESASTNTSSKSKLTDDEEESESTNVSIKSNAPKIYLYIQMEYCGGGTLSNWITERNSGVTRSKKDALDIFQQIVNGVEYIHSQGHFHRDLKPDNILFGRNGKVKIGDFGLVTTITNRNGASIERTMRTGTPSYMSPEQENQTTYNEKVDIFSLGLIFFELLWRIGTGMERAKLREGLRCGELPEEFCTEYTTEHVLIRKMLSKAPANRPGAKDISKQLNVLLKEQTLPISQNRTV